MQMLTFPFGQKQTLDIEIAAQTRIITKLID